MQALLLSLLLSFTASAQPQGKMPDLSKRYHVSSITKAEVNEDTQKLLAHMSLAAQSIDYGLKSSALDHLATARASVTQILKEKTSQTQELGQLPMGKLTMGEGEKSRSYFVPVWNGEEVDDEVKDISLGKEPKLEITKSTIIQTTVRMDMALVEKRLSETVKLLEKNDYQNAQATLDAIYDEVVVDEEVISEPLVNVWSNLMLVHAFVGNGTFSSAKFTLKKAKASLAELERSKKIKTDSLEVKELHREIDLLAQELDEKAPGFLSRVKKKTKAWIEKVKRWRK